MIVLSNLFFNMTLFRVIRTHKHDGNSGEYSMAAMKPKAYTVATQRDSWFTQVSLWYYRYYDII